MSTRDVREKCQLNLNKCFFFEIACFYLSPLSLFSIELCFKLVRLLFKFDYLLCLKLITLVRIAATLKVDFEQFVQVFFKQLLNFFGVGES